MAKSSSVIYGVEYTGPMPDETIVVRSGGKEIVIDVLALLSNYECVYGDGCQGTEPWFGEDLRTKKFDDPKVAGCCRTAPGLNLQSWDTTERMAKGVDNLTYEDSENLDAIRESWFKTDNEGRPKEIRSLKGNCIFLNSDKHENPGCALWAHGLRTGQRPQDIRPLICHTEPLMLRDVGESEVTGRAILSLRPYWHGWFNPEKWFCTKDPSTYRATSPVYQRMDEQLDWLLDDADLKKKVVEALEQAWSERGDRIKKEVWNQPVFLPEPKLWPEIRKNRQKEDDRRTDVMERRSKRDVVEVEPIFDLGLTEET